MGVRFELSNVIDRPVEKVFHFYAAEHVRNHPRWDPDIQLWLDEEGPIRVGTVIQRINRRSGTPVQGTMEVTEYEPNQAFGVLTREGPVTTRGRTTFEAVSDQQTRITIAFEMDLPAVDEKMREFIMSRLERSGKNMQQLMETEL